MSGEFQHKLEAEKNLARSHYKSLKILFGIITPGKKKYLFWPFLARKNTV